MKNKDVTATAERAEDGREFAEMLKTLTDAEKAQVKGIIIGLTIAREAWPVTAPEKMVVSMA